MLTVNEVQQKLNTIGYFNQFVVVFNKVDGTERKMRCWMEPPVDTKEKPYVPVHDVDNGDAFRSFRLDSVVSLSEVS